MSNTHIDLESGSGHPESRRARPSSIGTALAVGLVFLAACSGSENVDGQATDALATTQTEPGGAVSFSVSISEPASIDPGLIQEVEGGHVTRLLFETLVTLSPELELIPGVATDWGVADDGVTWTFNLDPAATYSDGRPVVAADFAFAFARSADPDLASPSAYQGLPIAGWAAVNDAEPNGSIGETPISGVTAVDDHTLSVVTDGPFSLLPKVLTYPIFAPIAADYVDTPDKAAAFAEQPTGNGMYVMSGSWDHNVGITVERNPSFHGTPGVADQIEFKIYSDMSTAYRDFEAGNVDIARNIAPEQIASAISDHPDEFVKTQTAILGYIGFPTTVAPFDKPDIRKAFSLAIDREAIAERVYSGTQSPATGMVPKQVPGALQETCDSCTYDPERAKALFDAAGGVPGDSIVVYDISDDGQEGLDPILNSWREVFGIDIEVRSFEFAQYFDETAADKVSGPFELGWVWDYPSGYSFLSPLFESTSGVNNFGYANAEFDAELAKVRVAKDEESGLPFLAEAQRIVESEMPLAPVLFANDLGVYAPKFTDIAVDAGAIWRLELIGVNN